jgi:hypothetical protein
MPAPGRALSRVPLQQLPAQAQQLQLRLLRLEARRDQPAARRGERVLDLAQLDRGAEPEAEALQRHLHVLPGELNVLLLQVREQDAVAVAGMGGLQPGERPGARLPDRQLAALLAQPRVLQPPLAVQPVEEVEAECSARKPAVGCVGTKPSWSESPPCCSRAAARRAGTTRCGARAAPARRSRVRAPPRAACGCRAARRSVSPSSVSAAVDRDAVGDAELGAASRASSSLSAALLVAIATSWRSSAARSALRSTCARRTSSSEAEPTSRRPSAMRSRSSEISIDSRSTSSCCCCRTMSK